MEPYPQQIETEQALDEFLTRPEPELVEWARTVSSPLVLLGAGGKLGPTLAVLARRAAQAAGCKLEIVAASRFSDPAARAWLEERHVRTLACDLMERAALQQLPNTDNLIYLAGMKFGTSENPAATWAASTLLPANVCERYPHSRIVALSSGSIYPLTPVARGGVLETEPLTPLGEYANACVGRERIFEYYSQRNATPVVLLRLFYAVELRYGLLVDLAYKVFSEQPIDLSMGYFNWIWQGDANGLILRSLALARTPPAAYNLTRPQIQSVRSVAEQFGELLGKPAHLTGREADTALLGNPAGLCAALGAPQAPLELVMRWIAGWLQRDGRLLGKPTHFEVRDGRY